MTFRLKCCIARVDTIELVIFILYTYSYITYIKSQIEYFYLFLSFNQEL